MPHREARREVQQGSPAEGHDAMPRPEEFGENGFSDEAGGASQKYGAWGAIHHAGAMRNKRAASKGAIPRDLGCPESRTYTAT